MRSLALAGRTLSRATEADAQAWAHARHLKPCQLAIHPMLQHIVAAQLLCEWSPEQIAEWLKLAFPGPGTMQVSHETIFRSVFK